jgi:hypothetical protein
LTTSDAIVICAAVGGVVASAGGALTAGSTGAGSTGVASTGGATEVASGVAVATSGVDVKVGNGVRVGNGVGAVAALPKSAQPARFSSANKVTPTLAARCRFGNKLIDFMALVHPVQLL